MPEKPQDDIVRARGIGLKNSEWAELEKIGHELGWKPLSVAVYAIRYFIKLYREGRIKTQSRTTKTLPDL